MNFDFLRSFLHLVRRCIKNPFKVYNKDTGERMEEFEEELNKPEFLDFVEYRIMKDIAEGTGIKVEDLFGKKTKFPKNGKNYTFSEKK